MQLYKQNPYEKFFIFTIYQNYTLALSPTRRVWGLISPTWVWEPFPRNIWRYQCLRYCLLTATQDIRSGCMLTMSNPPPPISPIPMHCEKNRKTWWWNDVLIVSPGRYCWRILWIQQRYAAYAAAASHSCVRSNSCISWRISFKFCMEVYLGKIYTPIVFGDAAPSVPSFIGSKVIFWWKSCVRSAGHISWQISFKFFTAVHHSQIYTPIVIGDAAPSVPSFIGSFLVRFLSNVV